MKVISFTAAALIASAVASPFEQRTILETDALAALGVLNLGIHVATKGYPEPKKCSLVKTALRREWYVELSPHSSLANAVRSTLSSSEKKEYIAAVNCLSKKPAKTPAGLAAGAKNRYDDFVVTHINQTLSIHGTGNFLTWHRYFTWAYEQTLRKECGYKGYQPYYSWPKWASNPLKSPAFDGSATSMSGNGAFQANRTNTCIPSPAQCGISLPPGNGGGCVTSGPFKESV